ncbi:MAG: 5-formyltetrahydrofolate cyclo-ligase [Clostridia bacterium]|nr:5-formyltetrahydrofolate cyclo-ligase [Clostridia bacterium]
MSYIRDVKNKIRETYRSRRDELSPEQKAAWDKKIIQNITSLASYRFADVILAYHPLDGEIDIRPLLESALAAGKKVALPLCYAEGRMDFFYITSLDNLNDGKFGLKEPSPDNEKYDRDNPAQVLMLIPALVYDQNGYRLGYGRGYYDRYVNSFHGTKAGLCYRAFLHPTPLPHGRFDFAVDYIVTEKGVKLIEKA